MSDAPTSAGADYAPFDPRDIVTPYAFEVQEDLLGTPLASPSRRLMAMLVDIAIAGVIANVTGALIGFVTAYVFWRVGTRRRLESWWKRAGRGVLVFVGSCVLFGMSVALVEDVDEWRAAGPGLSALLPGGGSSGDEAASDPENEDAPGEEASPESAADEPAPSESARPRNLTDSLVRRMAQQAPTPGVDSLQVARALERAMAAPKDRGPVLDSVDGAATPDLLRGMAEAVAARDSAAVDTLLGPVQTAVAGRRLERLEDRADELQNRTFELEDRVDDLKEQLSNPSLWRMTRATVNDLGVTFGWVGLYFTLFLAWWRGRTPGKWLFGLRVVRLSGQPMGLWFALERFGGYAAGIATGFFGFLQVYWDPNRQAIHDRIARTVVIRPAGKRTASMDQIRRWSESDGGETGG